MSLYFRPLIHTLSNALETPLGAMQYCFLSDSDFEIISTVVASAVLVDLAVLNLCWVSGRILFVSRNVLVLLFIIFSKSFPGASNRDIDR